MPIDERHQKQKKKNLTLLAVLLFIVALLFAITLIKLSGMGAAG
jgi:accessory gene regulator protein AgrB